LRDPDAPVGDIAFVLGYVCHVALAAWWSMGYLGLFDPDQRPTLLGVGRLSFDPTDHVTPEAIAVAPIPKGFPQAEIRLIGEFDREMDTCEPAEMFAGRLEMSLAKRSPEQREITYRLYEEQLRAPRVSEADARANLERPTAGAIRQLLVAVRPPLLSDAR